MDRNELSLILQEGEGLTIEFKENVNSDLPKEFAAMANSVGGKIFIGVNDKKIQTGIAITNALLSQIQDMATHCDPPVTIEISSFENILIVHVDEGLNKPYRCSKGFYIRNGANIMVEIFDDRVQISNPGGLPKGLPPEKFGTLSISRNPIISSLLHRAGYIEKMGTGISRIKNALTVAGNPEPIFEFDTFFTITFKRVALLHKKAKGITTQETTQERILALIGKTLVLPEKNLQPS